MIKKVIGITILVIILGIVGLEFYAFTELEAGFRAYEEFQSDLKESRDVFDYDNIAYDSYNDTTRDEYSNFYEDSAESSYKKAQSHFRRAATYDILGIVFPKFNDIESIIKIMNNSTNNT